MSTLATDDGLSLPALSGRLQRIREKIKKAAEKSGRNDAAIQLVAVGKTVPQETLVLLESLGVFHIGENKVQEAAAKRAGFTSPRWHHHFIGHLQTNKAKKAVELFDVIQTVDRPKCAELLNRLSLEAGKRQRCLVEVKVSSEPNKTGLPLTEVGDFLKKFSDYPHLKLEGLMTIAPYGLSELELRACFRSFAQLAREQISVLGPNPVLSFGMSDDFEVAIEEGSTMVRIGRALFGERIK